LFCRGDENDVIIVIQRNILTKLNSVSGMDGKCNLLCLSISQSGDEGYSGKSIEFMFPWKGGSSYP
jgi:hypothetical protein